MAGAMHTTKANSLRGSSFMGQDLALQPGRFASRGSAKPCLRTVALFDFFKKKSPVVAPVVRPTIVPEPSYNIPIALAGITAIEAVAGAPVPAAITGILGAFLALQATRINFIFDDQALEVRQRSSEEPQENAFVGGESRWDYSTFTNWEFWWPNFPVLVYFKENQTKPEGQIHFFPIIFDGKKLYDVMVERCGNSQNSLPKAAAAGDADASS